MSLRCVYETCITLYCINLYGINLYGINLYGINLYGPNQDDPYLLENIYTNLLNLQATNDHPIMLVDYNTVLSTSMDRKANHSSPYPYGDHKYYGLTTPDLLRYTWRRHN